MALFVCKLLGWTGRETNYVQSELASSLPPKLLAQIFFYLNDNEILNAGATCLHWRQVCLLPELWSKRSFKLTRKDREESLNLGLGIFPPELLAHIFVYLDEKNTLNAGATCLHWRQVCLLPELWRKRHFKLTGKEGLMIARHLHTFGSHLQYLTLTLEGSEEERKTMALSVQAVVAAVDQLRGFSCHGFHRSPVSLWNGAPNLDYDISTKSKIVTVLRGFLERQHSLCVVEFVDFNLDEEVAVPFMHTLDSLCKGSPMKNLTLRNVTPSTAWSLSVGECPYKRLERIGLSYRYLTDTALKQLLNASPALKGIMLHVDVSDSNKVIVTVTPDWQMTAISNPDLRVWLNIKPEVFFISYDFFLSPGMPLVGLTLDMSKKFKYKDSKEAVKDVAREISDVASHLSSSYLECFIVKPPPQLTSPFNLSDAIGELLEACPSLSLLCLHMTLAVKTLLHVAVAEQSLREEQGGQLAPARPPLHIHTKGYNKVLDQTVLERLSVVNPGFTTRVCPGCEAMLSKPRFI